MIDDDDSNELIITNIYYDKYNSCFSVTLA